LPVLTISALAKGFCIAEVRRVTETSIGFSIASSFFLCCRLWASNAHLSVGRIGL
jgi:hypothetical protein